MATILTVDDSASMRQMVAFTLKGAGHTVLEAEDGQAALDAVKQWEYTPTLLNGVPVPVIMTVTVQFALS